MDISQLIIYPDLITIHKVCTLERSTKMIEVTCAIVLWVPVLILTKFKNFLIGSLIYDPWQRRDKASLRKHYAINSKCYLSFSNDKYRIVSFPSLFQLPNCNLCFLIVVDPGFPVKVRNFLCQNGRIGKHRGVWAGTDGVP